MQGSDIPQDTLFSTVILEEHILENHPLRPIGQVVDKALKRLNQNFTPCLSYRHWPQINPAGEIAAEPMAKTRGCPLVICQGGEPDQAQTNQKAFWMAEDRGKLAQDFVHRPQEVGLSIFPEIFGLQADLDMPSVAVS